MKKLLLFLTIAAGLTACIKDDVYVEPTMEQYKLTTEWTVPVQDDCITVVEYNGEVIYEGNVPMNIDVPKDNYGSTRSLEGLEWHFVPNGKPLLGNSYYTEYRNGIFAFEDAPNGDNDYNDFICYFKEAYSVFLKGVHQIDHILFKKLEILPKALGNSIPLSFGIELVNVNSGDMIADIIIYKDIRKEAFNGATGFINTDKNIPEFELNSKCDKIITEQAFRPENDLKNSELGINYYIIANGKKYYTADSNRAKLTENKTPYGLYIPTTSNYWDYPIEKSPIWEGYPNFKNWILGKKQGPFSERKSKYLYSMQKHSQN